MTADPKFGPTRPGPSHRTGTGTVWLFGLHAVEAALRNPARIKHRLVVTRNAAKKLQAAIEASGVAHEIADSRKFTAPIDRSSVHQGAALEAAPLSQPSLDSIAATEDRQRIVVLLDRVTDPHNVGAIIRSASIFGAAGVITTARHSPPETGALAKSASGALEFVPFLRIRNLSSAMISLRGAGWMLVGFDPAAGHPMLDAAATCAASRVGLVLGSEGSGLRSGTKQNCDILVSIGIPSSPVSLNVSNAAAIALHAFTTGACKGRMDQLATIAIGAD